MLMALSLATSQLFNYSTSQPSLILTMKSFLTILLFCFSIDCFAQDVINIDGVDCGMNGSAKNEEAYKLNEYKNRYNFPSKTDFDTTIRIQDLAKSADPNQFSPNKAVILRGYVYNVKMGGVETCNCRTKDPNFRDTHIELVSNADATGPDQRVIVEVTPRLRAIMAKQGQDWSTGALRSTIKGHEVEIGGWLMYDAEHETAAFANDPDDVIGSKNWRATCWEVHPVTYIKIVDGKTASLSTALQEQTQVQNHSAQQSSQTSHAGLIIAIVLILIAVIVAVLYFSGKKRS